MTGAFGAEERMRTQIVNSALTLCRLPRYRSSSRSSAFPHRTLWIAVACLSILLFAVVMPTTADAQSWWKQLEDAGKAILDRATDQGSQPSEAQQDQQTAPLPQPPRDTNPSYTRAQVREAQRILLDLGYKPGAVDGTYVPATTTAIRAYQSDHGLLPTGVPSSELVAELRKTQDAKLRAAPPQSPTRSASQQTSLKSRSGMLVPAPEGTPISEAQTAQIQKAENTTTSTSGLDALAPAGVRIGAKLSTVDAGLTAAGYKIIGKCVYYKKVDAGNISLTLHAGKRCEANAPLAHINYQQRRIPVDGSPAEIVDRIARKLGQNGKCIRLDKNSANCNWHFPPNAPSVQHVMLRFDARDPSLQLSLKAVDEPSEDRPKLSPDGDFDFPDPRAPANIAIGLIADEVRNRLRRARFAKMAFPDNQYMLKEGNERTTIQIWFGNNRSERFSGRVSFIEYRTTRLKYVNVANHFITQWNKQLDTKGNCSLGKNITTCQWLSPPAAPLVQEVRLQFDTAKPELVLTSKAVPNLEARFSKTATGSSPESGKFDFLTLHGIQMGMELNKAKIALRSAGFTDPSRNKCEFKKDQLRVQLNTGSNYRDCVEGKAVSRIRYDGLRAEGSLLDFVKRANQQIGTDARCSGLTDNSITLCEWLSPPNSPLVKRITLHGSKTWLQLNSLAIEDLEALVKLPPPKSIPMSEQPWWTQELAKAESAAKTVKFTGSERFDQLSRAEKQRLGGEANTVYDYCKGQQLFSTFHDCRCVAGKFIDARLANEEMKKPATSAHAQAGQAKSQEDPLERWRRIQEERSVKQKHKSRNTSRKELISIADKVADQCPNKPGAADYGHKQCTGLYKRSLSNPDDLKAYCTCYADTFAAKYMEDPRAFIPNITGIGAASALECKR